MQSNIAMVLMLLLLQAYACWTVCICIVLMFAAFIKVVQPTLDVVLVVRRAKRSPENTDE